MVALQRAHEARREHAHRAGGHIRGHRAVYVEVVIMEVVRQQSCHRVEALYLFLLLGSRTRHSLKESYPYIENVSKYDVCPMTLR